MSDQTPDDHPAPRPTPPVQADGRDRLRAAFTKPGVRGQAIVAVLLAVLGFAAVTQVKANDKDDQYLGARQGDLVQYINNLSLASQRTEAEIAKLQRTRDALRSDTASRRTAVERAQQQADTLGILAGTVPAVGEGIRVTVTDDAGGSGAVGADQLLNGLEELRDAGAEVIEINDKVRVVAQTSVRDTGDGGVMVDGTVVRAPFVIDAIGDSHTLADALDFSGGFLSSVRDLGGKADVRQLDDVRVASVVEPKAARYAQPGPTG
ncbi:MAG: DUF881 domain-containing protein [Nocardioidaceae bacterium]|nr:DUF881 domain-containing protein [Nocardioidaceae bacterium]NUS50758.1 DUF881 domain-containing protein [Nocardioidaceae bacterium]